MVAKHGHLVFGQHLHVELDTVPNQGLESENSSLQSHAFHKDHPDNMKKWVSASTNTAPRLSTPDLPLSVRSIA